MSVFKRMHVPAISHAPIMRLAALSTLIAASPAAFGVTAAVPTAGLAVTSVIVGGAGAIAGDSWYIRALGYATGLVDPSPGTFYHGKFVYDYPEQLLTPTSVGWFGNFAADPSQPAPPILPGAFFDTNTVSYDWHQAPNPNMNVSFTASGGVLTVEFDAPKGITVDAGSHFNLLNIQFQNTSGQTLQWKLAGAGDASNFFQDAAQQILTCKPDQSYAIAVMCGTDAPANKYTITAVPEPSTYALGLAGLMVLSTQIRRVRFRKFD